MEAPEESFPARVTDAYIKAHVPAMTAEEYEAFLALLRQRNWHDHELEARVYPFAPVDPGTHAARPAQDPSEVASDPSATSSVERSVHINTTGRQPTALIPRTALQRTTVEIEGIAYRSEVDGDEVLVPGAALHPSWARIVGDHLVELTLGAKVPPLLKTIDSGRHPEVLSGSSIIAAVVGHPRRDPRGQPITFVWTDHVSLAESGDPTRAMDFSWVRDEQAEHIRALTGRVRLATVPPDHDSAPTATTSSDIQERVVLIRIPRLHHPGMTSLELYEATRKWWVMSPLRHNPDFAFTVVDGFVQAVFRIDEWEQDPGSRRWAFHGARDLKREKLYAGLDVTNYLPAGAQNPIRYVNC